MTSDTFHLAWFLNFVAHLTDVVVTRIAGMPQSCLQPGMAANIAEKCLRALDNLHRHGIVHGDIKPSNIMLDQYGSIRVVDIGSAFEISDPPRRYTWTPRYAPPEIFRGERWTPQSDLASLGYVLIEMLSGRPAVDGPDIESHSTRLCGPDWEGEQLKKKEQLPDRLGEILPAHVQRSQLLVDTIRRLIDPDPRQRFARAGETLEGPTSIYEFQQDLARSRLVVPYCQEIKRWLTDVMRVI